MLLLKTIKTNLLAMNILETYSFATKSGLMLSSFRIARNEGLILLEKFQGQKLEEYSSSRCDYYYYLLNDGRILFLPQGPEVYIYEPYNAFLAHMEETHIAKHIPNTPPFQRIKHLPGGRKIFSTVISKEEAELLCANATPIERDAFLLADGRVLTERGWGNAVYDNRADWQAILDFYVLEGQTHRRMSSGEYRGPFLYHLCGWNPYGQEVLNKIDEIAAKLPGLLNAPEALFDGSINNLPKIDKYLYKQVMSDAFAELAFMPLLAYIGKVQISNRSGEWVLLHDEVCDLWIPDIRELDGEMKILYHPLWIILDSRNETYYRPLMIVLNHKASMPESDD